MKVDVEVVWTRMLDQQLTNTVSAVVTVPVKRDAERKTLPLTFRRRLPLARKHVQDQQCLRCAAADKDQWHVFAESYQSGVRRASAPLAIECHAYRVNGAASAPTSSGVRLRWFGCLRFGVAPR